MARAKPAKPNGYSTASAGRGSDVPKAVAVSAQFADDKITRREYLEWAGSTIQSHSGNRSGINYVIAAALGNLVHEYARLFNEFHVAIEADPESAVQRAGDLTKILFQDIALLNAGQG